MYAFGGQRTVRVPPRTGAAREPTPDQRKKDIADGLLAGETCTQIGAHLFISDKTVSSHVFNILRTTGTTSRIELAALARPAADS